MLKIKCITFLTDRLFSVHHNVRDAVPMNTRRELLKLWLIASVGWIGACIWPVDSNCFFEPYPWCKLWAFPMTKYYIPSDAQVEILAMIISTPAAILTIGTAILWTAKRARQ
jgi:hypothetical protein